MGGDWRPEAPSRETALVSALQRALPRRLGTMLNDSLGTRLASFPGLPGRDIGLKAWGAWERDY